MQDIALLWNELWTKYGGAAQWLLAIVGLLSGIVGGVVGIRKWMQLQQADKLLHEQTGKVYQQAMTHIAASAESQNRQTEAIMKQTGVIGTLSENVTEVFSKIQEREIEHHKQLAKLFQKAYGQDKAELTSQKRRRKPKAAST